MAVLTFAKWIAEAPMWILSLPEGLQRLVFQFYQVFVYENRWRFFTNGLATTFAVTLGALVIGVIIGMIVALIRTTHDSQPKKPNFILRILNGICKIYVTVLRGTPLMVQLLIMGFVIMVPKGSAQTTFCAIVTLGINSGAYVAEIARSGIMSINVGQREAGRSLGLSKLQTMAKIIFPQAIRYILPAIGNEMIALLKETSVAGYVAVRDVTKAGDQIRNITYDSVSPLMTVALTYLALVVLMTSLLNVIEKRLSKSDKG